MIRVAERAPGCWGYHLHEDEGSPKFGGGRLTMLCGETMLAWDTAIPLSSWGNKSSHIPESFCSGCTDAYAKLSRL